MLGMMLIDLPLSKFVVYLILTNTAESFQSTCVLETGLSDFNGMTISLLKMHFRKLPPKVISYVEILKIWKMRCL